MTNSSFPFQDNPRPKSSQTPPGHYQQNLHADNEPSHVSNNHGEASSSRYTMKILKILKSVKQVTTAKTTTTTTKRHAVAGFSERGFQKFTSSRRAVWIAFAVFLLYLIVGIAVFAVWMDDWNAIDAAYFTVTTFTTVGYGDLFPVTKGQRIFAMFFVTIGIMIIGGVVLGVVMNTLFVMFEKSLRTSAEQAQSQLVKKLRKISSRNTKSASPPLPPPQSSLTQEQQERNHEHEDDEQSRDSSCALPWKATLRYLGLAALIFVPGIVIGHFEEWELHESIYYSIVTATTVGYGDLSPKKMWTRFAACFYLPLCVTIMAGIFGKITSIYLDKKTREAEEEFFQRQLTHQDIQKMDFGGDGTVNPEEFLIFMLVNMGKVDMDSIHQIQSLFQKLDRDRNGFLDAQDLLLMAYGDDDVHDNHDDGAHVDKHANV